MRGTMLAVGMTFGAATTAVGEPVDSLLTQASTFCEQAYAAKKVKEKMKEIHFPMAILDWDDKAKAWRFVAPGDAVAASFKAEYGPKHVKFEDLRPTDAAAVRSVACVKRSAPIEMGTYGTVVELSSSPGRQPAMGYSVHFRIIDWPTGKAVTDWDWEAKPPNLQKESENNHAKTGPDELALWIGWIYSARVKK